MVEAREVVVQDDFADGVVAEVSEVSAGGVETGGMVIWDIGEPLQSDEERVVSYVVRLVNEIDESTTTSNIATISIDGVQVAQAENRMAIEPPPPAATETQPAAQVFENQPLMVAVLVVPSLLVGLLVAMFQAATQINEQTLSFLPRLLVMLVTLIVAGPWLVQSFMEYILQLYGSIPQLIG